MLARKLTSSGEETNLNFRGTIAALNEAGFLIRAYRPETRQERESILREEPKSVQRPDAMNPYPVYLGVEIRTAKDHGKFPFEVIE